MITTTATTKYQKTIIICEWVYIWRALCYFLHRSLLLLLCIFKLKVSISQQRYVNVCKRMYTATVIRIPTSNHYKWTQIEIRRDVCWFSIWNLNFERSCDFYFCFAHIIHSAPHPAFPTSFVFLLLPTFTFAGSKGKPLSDVINLAYLTCSIYRKSR